MMHWVLPLGDLSDPKGEETEGQVVFTRETAHGSSASVLKEHILGGSEMVRMHLRPPDRAQEGRDHLQLLRLLRRVFVN